jgi:D-alanyl-D-alanine carboxypeptidase (penicillin-binding protein 5/6)
VIDANDQTLPSTDPLFLRTNGDLMRSMRHLSTGLTLCVALILAATKQTAYGARYSIGDDPPFAAALLLEAETGTVLFSYNSDKARSPASTLKLLLQLVVMDGVQAGRLSLTDSIYTSAWASRMGGSQVFLREGEVFPLEELMHAIVIASANDACVAVAEHIGGTVEGFVDLMNDKAEQIGLTQTRCVNVHGLDDTPADEGNLTSARDLSLIALSLIQHPQILEWSSIRSAPFRDGKFKLWATNRLLRKFPGLDGLKTGYTQRAGYNLVATAKRRDMRLVSVVMGSRGERARDKESARLLLWGFNNFVKAPISVAGDSSGVVALDWGLSPDVTAVTAGGAIAVLTPEERRRLHHEVRLPTLWEAPVKEGDSLGVLAISLDDSLLAQIDLVAATSIERMSVWEKLMSYF